MRDKKMENIKIIKTSQQIKTKNSKDIDDIDKESKEDEEEEEQVPKIIIDQRNEKKLYESYKRDLGISEFRMKKAIKSVRKWVANVETQRNLQMRNDFNEEKEFKLEKQKEIQNQIEEYIQ